MENQMVEWPVLGKVGIPFMIAGVAGAKLNSTRVVEAVVIALVSSSIMAMAGYYLAFPVLQEQVKQVRSDIQDIKSGQKEAIARIENYQLERRTVRDQQQQQTDSRLRHIEIEVARRK